MPRSLNVAPFSARSILFNLMFAVFVAATFAPASAFAQAQGNNASQTDAEWSASERRDSAQSSGNEPTTPWSFRAGMGFTIDPNNFLLSFELPYRFDQYVSVGPLFQIGLEDDRYLVAPSVNLTITIPDLPGDSLDRFRPNFFTGVGFAVIEKEDTVGNDREAAFLINAGFGVDYVVSERVSVGSRMILNFLPGRALSNKFFYTWEVASIKLAF